jgi:superfamily II DNA or RNA helicase
MPSILAGAQTVRIADIKANIVVRGPIFPEPVQVLVVVPMGESVKIIGKGLDSGKVHEPILSPDQVAKLTASPEQKPYDGDPLRFRLGVEALRLALAYEYDPYFSLSIARVDPLPHQLEAVYDHFIKLPRIRFLLADDPGAGKTIMAGLLLKEMKIRGLVKRTLIVTPANLTFQWQRELKDKFRETFEIVRGDVLRANYGTNPWQEKNQVITSVSWVSRIEDARESLLRSHWDLIIVDEAHKMSASSPDHKTLAYALGESLSTMTDHYLLMTATPHKGDPEHFCLFLRLLDADVYADVKSLEEAMQRNSAPFYLRRTKEALVTFPDPDTGQIKKLFTKRIVQTVAFQIDSDEWDFYDALTRYVEDQSIRAQAANATTGRAIGFMMAMLQRRLASSVYAARRSLERMREKRQRILEDPQAYRQEQIAKKLPDDFDELPDDERQQIMSDLEEVVASVDPAALREEIIQLTRLIDQARVLEQREVETKLNKLRDVISSQGVFKDPSTKLLVFTEHKDTLDYLVDRLTHWGLNVTQIHGGMKIGDRDMTGTRLHAERIFRDRDGAQVLVATEAAGEGINLQFCWLMINYDIPWNPTRLEQRMGRIHRYGQEKDCLIFNFVASNTREGSVMEKLFERIQAIEDDLDPGRTGKVFNVLGDIFPANQLEKMIRDMYLHNQTEESIKSRIVEEVDTSRFRQITESTLEGLARRELNLSAIVGKSAEAKERRLVPEVIEDFFTHAGPVIGLLPKESAAGSHLYRVGRVPRHLWPMGDRLEPRFGKLGQEYKQIVFDKALLAKDATSEWVTPGHPLFETVRQALSDEVRDDLLRGAVFFDLHSPEPYHLDVFSASVKDGLANELHRRLFVVQSFPDGRLVVKQPTIFLDLAVAPKGAAAPSSDRLPSLDQREHALLEQCLNAFLAETASQRCREAETIRRHIEISLNELIHRQNMTLARLVEQQETGDRSPQLAGNISQCETRLDELNSRRERRLADLERECQCAISDIQRIGHAWVLPHPERSSPGLAAMVRDDEIERLAVQAAITHEEAEGRVVESVEAQNRGFDLISRRPHPEDPATAIDVRFIEVKGRAGVGEIALTENEYRTSERLKKDYWLYAVFNCGSKPQVHAIRDPSRLGWKSVVTVEHYSVDARAIIAAEEKA